VDDVIKQIRRNQDVQDERARKNGWPLKDRQAFEAENESLRAEMIEQRRVDTHAAVVTYIGAGEKYYYQAFPDDQAGSLEEIRSAGVKPLKDEQVITWNGKESANLTRALEHYPRFGGLLVLSARKINVMNPTRYGHDVPEMNWWVKTFFRLQGQHVEHVTTPEGDDALRLVIGSSEAALMDVEMTVIPSKGYALRSSNDRHGGSLGIAAVRIREDMSDYVEAARGIWMPRHIVREEFDADDKLKSRVEFLALEDPRVNTPVEDGKFEQAGAENVSVVDERRPAAAKAQVAKPEAKDSPAPAKN
jgi:hypothetical protein